MKLSHYVAAFLASRGVRHVFAISGAGNVHLLEGISLRDDLEIVCPHHEQAGVMASLAYHRISGRMGVMITTAGPGAINAVTGVLDAWADSIPCLILSGQEKSAWARPDNPLRMWGVQGTPITEIVSRICKYAAMVREPETIRYHLERAWHEATTGRPGPVWLDIPSDIQARQINAEDLQGYIPPPLGRPLLDEELPTLFELLATASRPVLWLGHGIRLAGALPLLPAFLERVPVPFLTSWNGADMVDSFHPRNFGHAGVYGQRCGNFVVQNADFILAIGTRLAIPQVGYEWDEFARGARIAVVDVDPSELSKFPATQRFLPIRSDAADFLAAFLERAPACPQRPEWEEACQRWRERYPLVEPGTHDETPGRLNTYRFVQRLERHLSPDDVVVTDMGAALTSTHQVLRVKEGQRLVTSTGLGEMGFGLPGAIGAALAHEKRVILLAGDGSMMMNIQELQTAVHNRLSIKIFLFANDGYLTIRQTQRSLFGESLVASGAASGVTCPDFVRVAEAFGIPAFDVRDPGEVDGAIDRCLSGDGPILCQLSMDPEQILGPKLSLSVRADGTLVSPPLEDLSPLLPRDVLRTEMLGGLHPKSAALADERQEPSR
ncbi:MAG: thiamine pyrophosphate-binding protein [Thermoanaerobaculia bacterium]|nr:thiamine pyrophosphate-binding protein [Thermoanaerobaculia bacterium]